MSLPVLVVATGNEGKAREIRAFLEGRAQVETLRDHPDIEMPEETEPDFDGNARLKAEFVRDALGCAVLADDSGLAVDALNGAPGVRSARYVEGTDEDRTQAVLDHLADVPEGRRAGRFICAMAFARPGAETTSVEGRVEGQIGFRTKGQGGFGYDPIFIPDADPLRTMAELTRAEKQEISHRGEALRKIRPALDAHFSGSG